MVERREVLGGGLLAGVAAAFGGPAAEQARRDPVDEAAESKVAGSLDRLRQAFENRHDSPDVTQIRTQQRTFLKANQKFPDYMDVGIDVWERMHDWHVRTGQPLAITRTSDGHYAMTLGVTMLILQPQQVGSYISWGYDNR